MKTCSTCSYEKNLEDFYSHKLTSDGKDSICKECRKAISKKQKAKMKELIESIKKESKCIRCGEDEPVALDFHHLGDDKQFNIGQAVTDGHGMQKILDEIEKCVVLCANCHRKLHAGLFILD